MFQLERETPLKDYIGEKKKSYLSILGTPIRIYKCTWPDLPSNPDRETRTQSIELKLKIYVYQKY